MSVVGIRELKNRLAEYLRQTKEGKEVIVTERGKPIAVIRPTTRKIRGASLEVKLAEIAAEGLVMLPRKRLRPKMPRIKIKGPPISTTIIEERR